MKLRVNLYSDTLLPPVKRLTFIRLLQISALFTVIALFAVAGSYYLLTNANAEKLKLSQEKSRLDNEKTSLLAEVEKRKPNAELVAKVDLSHQQLLLKRMLLTKLSQSDAFTSQGYSALLKDLASVADGGIWLSHININDNRYTFKGFTSSAHRVPQWVEQLKNTEALKGHAFAAMTMARAENLPLAFTLTSKPAEDKDAAKDVAKERP